MSKFLDIFERFKSGTATDEENAIVHDEIEKYTVIEEYLAEEFDRALPEATDVDNTSAGKRIARKVRFKIIGTVLISLLVVAALYTAVVYLCNNYFYNPNQGIAEVYGGDGQLRLDMWAFNSLHSPEYTTMYAEAWRDGLGSYQLRIDQHNLFTGRLEVVSERIVRGEAMSKDDRILNGYWRLPIGNAFGYREGTMSWIDETGVSHSTPMEEIFKGQIDELRILPESSRVSAYVTFEKDMTLEEFAQLHDEWSGDVWFLYAAVESREGYIPNTLGFSPDGGGIIMESLPPDFPYLQLSNHYEELQTDPAYVWEQHFRALLGHLISRPQFLETLVPVNGLSPQYYEQVLDYIDENGMEVYGSLISGSAEAVLSFLESESLSDFYVNDVRLSVLSRD